MSSNAIEVEITGRLTPLQADALRAASTGENKKRLDRYFVNFSTEESLARHLDVRTRVTNGKPELIIKQGAWGSGVRREVSVPCGAGSFVDLTAALVALGWTRACGGRRVIERFDIGDVEISIVEVPDYTLFYEAEVTASPDAASGARRDLESWAAARELHVFTPEEYKTFVLDLDANANEEFDFTAQETWARLAESCAPSVVQP